MWFVSCDFQLFPALAFRSRLACQFHGLFPALRLIFYIEGTTIIVKSVAKATTFASFFLLSPNPWSNFELNKVFVRLIVLVYPNTEWGRGGGIFSIKSELC